ncbi:MAG: MFS transporter [Bacteroidales bacterium]|nr:MFS transporter [Bacteroidales bacterium]
MKKITLSHFLVKNFELKQQEVPIFLMLFLHSFFLGLAGAFYFTPANSEFIKHFGSEQLPYAYIASGIGGYFFTQIYSWMQKRIESRTLFMGALIFMTLATLISPMLLGHVDSKWLSMFVFIWAWPFLSMVGIECGALSLKFLNLVQVKRIFALFSIGGVLAAMMGYLIIPALSKVISHSYTLLYISAFGFIIGIVTLVILYQKYPQKLREERMQLEKKKKDGGGKLLSLKPTNDGTGFIDLLKKSYFRYIFICATLSMTIIYVTDFSFLSTVKIQIAPENTPQFLTLVYGGLKIGELLLSFFSARILSRYGVKLGLLILPICMVVITTLAALVGLTSVESIVFLILITLNKSQERILRRGLDDPAFNILYQPLPDEEKAAVQTKVGVVQQFSTGIAGVVLLAVNTIITLRGEYDFKYFMLFFIPILVAWVISSMKLYESYKETINKISKDFSKESRRDVNKSMYGPELLRKYIKVNNPNIQRMAVMILSETAPRSLESYAAQLLESQDEVVEKAVLRNIDPTWRSRLATPCGTLFQNAKNPEIRLLAERAQTYLSYEGISKKADSSEIEALVASEYVSDKIKLVKYLFKNDTLLNEDIISSLLDNTDRNVKSAAITLAGNLRTPKMINKLISLLESPEYYNTAENVLLDIGDRVLPTLNEYFEKSMQPPEILLRIIELYAKFGSAPARAFLMNNINYPNRDIQQAVIAALYFCKYQATDEKDILTIKQKINETVENIVWIMACLNDIEDEKNTLKLVQSLDLERTNSIENLFNLLSLLQEPRLINLIQKTIIGKNNIFAVEIIDNNFPQEIKQLIKPLFDDLSTVQKIKKLGDFFPQREMSLEDRLKDIIKRDYSKLDTWTVARAVELLGKQHKAKSSDDVLSSSIDYKDLKLWVKSNIKDLLAMIRKSEMPDEMFLCLYHTDEMVYSTAAKIIYEENPLKCSDYLTNMSSDKQLLYAALKSGQPTLTDKIKHVKKHPLFFNVPEYLLAKVAKNITIHELSKGEELNTDDESVYIVEKGTLSCKVVVEGDVTFFKNDIITKGFNLDHDVKALFAKKESVVLAINRFEYFNTLIRETDIIPYILDENNRAMMARDDNAKEKETMEMF